MVQPRRGGSAGLCAILAAITIIAGLTPIGARLATAEIPVFTLAWARFGTAGLLLWVTLRARGARLRFAPSDRRRLVVLGLLCVPINQAGFLGGISLANASHAGLFYALAPVLVYWGSVAVGRTAYSRRMLLAAIAAAAGAAVVILPSLTLPGRGMTFLAGDLLLLVAVLSWSALVVGSQPLILRYRPLPALTGVFLLGTLLHTPLVFIDLGTFDWSGVTWRGLGGFAFITLATSYLNYLLTYNVLARFDATRAMIVTNGNFIVTATVEHLWFREPLTVFFFAGAALVSAAIAIDGLQRRRIPAAP